MAPPAEVSFAMVVVLFLVEGDRTTTTTSNWELKTFQWQVQTKGDRGDSRFFGTGGVSPAVRCVNSEQPEHEVSRRGHSSTLAHKSCYPTKVGNMFFLSVRGMAQRNRCPGGRPSVRYRRDVKW